MAGGAAEDEINICYFRVFRTMRPHQLHTKIAKATTPLSLSLGAAVAGVLRSSVLFLTPSQAHLEHRYTRCDNLLNGLTVGVGDRFDAAAGAPRACAALAANIRMKRPVRLECRSLRTSRASHQTT